jgi:aspartyl-tRNA(Asn)/glutamyl-tRNA(Gln) amidotransferase subunit A
MISGKFLAEANELCRLGVAELGAGFAAGKFTPLEVTQATLARAEVVQEQYNAFSLIDADAAIAVAKESTARWRSGTPLSAIDGVPTTIKDIVWVKDRAVRYGSRTTSSEPCAQDAPSVKRLRAAGAIFIGLTTTPEFGWKAITESPLTGVTRNPWNPQTTPGGSSGGAVVAAATGAGVLHIGTDGGGSIRKPAAWCGIYGLKPSYGRVGLHPHGAAWSLSHAGPMTRTVKDAALMLAVMAGPDERDQYSLPTNGGGYVRALGGSLKGLRVAYSATLGIAPVVDPEIAAAAARAARLLRDVGCRVETVRPTWPSPYECWRDTFFGGIATRLIPYLERRSEIDPGLLAIVEEVKGWPPTRYVQAWLDRLAWWQHARSFFEKYDLLLSPTVANPPLRIGEFFATEIAGKKVGREAGSAFTFPFNMTGQPAATVPCGFTRAGLPIGLQIVGRRFADVSVLRASAALERLQPWAGRRPPEA